MVSVLLILICLEIFIIKKLKTVKGIIHEYVATQSVKQFITSLKLFVSSISRWPMLLVSNASENFPAIKLFLAC